MDKKTLNRIVNAIYSECRIGDSLDEIKRLAMVSIRTIGEEKFTVAEMTEIVRQCYIRTTSFNPLSED